MNRVFASSNDSAIPCLGISSLIPRLSMYQAQRPTFSRSRPGRMSVDVPSPATDILPGRDLVNPPNRDAFADNVAFLHPKQWSSALGLILNRLMAHNENHMPSLSPGSPLLVIRGY